MNQPIPATWADVAMLCATCCALGIVITIAVYETIKRNKEREGK